MNYAQGNDLLSKYRQADSSEANYATPHRLVQMMMGGGLDKIAAAKGSIQRKEFEAKNLQIQWAISIIEGLRGSLNFEQGGEVAANLDALYDYMIRRLTKANSDNDIVPLDEVTELLGEIKSAWDQMPENIRNARTIDEIKALAG